MELLITTSNHLAQTTIFANFLVVDAPSIYNAIIEQLTLNALQAITSTYHLTLKFLTPARVGVVHGNQVEACCCYALALKGQTNTHQETNVINNFNFTNYLLTGELDNSLPYGSAPTSLPNSIVLVPIEVGLASAEANQAEPLKQLSSTPRRL